MVKKIVLIIGCCMSYASIYGSLGGHLISYTSPVGGLFSGMSIIDHDSRYYAVDVLKSTETDSKVAVTCAEIITRLAKITVGEGLFCRLKFREGGSTSLMWLSEFDHSTLAWIRAIKKVRPTPLGYAVLAGAAVTGVGIYAGVKRYAALSSANTKQKEHSEVAQLIQGV